MRNRFNMFIFILLLALINACDNGSSDKTSTSGGAVSAADQELGECFKAKSIETVTIEYTDGDLKVTHFDICTGCGWVQDVRYQLADAVLEIDEGAANTEWPFCDNCNYNYLSYTIPQISSGEYEILITLFSDREVLHESIDLDVQQSFEFTIGENPACE